MTDGDYRADSVGCDYHYGSQGLTQLSDPHDFRGSDFFFTTFTTFGTFENHGVSESQLAEPNSKKRYKNIDKNVSNTQIPNVCSYIRDPGSAPTGGNTQIV